MGGWISDQRKNTVVALLNSPSKIDLHKVDPVSFRNRTAVLGEFIVTHLKSYSY